LTKQLVLAFVHTAVLPGCQARGPAGKDLGNQLELAGGIIQAFTPLEVIFDIARCSSSP
jgi:hypothetical protein